MKYKTILVTGAGGFIGKSIVAKAQTLGYKVRGLEINTERADQVRSQYGIEVIVGSILDRNTRATALNKVDIVVHTAAITKESGPVEEFRKTNVEGSYQLADDARRGKVKTFIHLSSVMVYGFHYLPYVTEMGILDGSGSSYAQTKIEGEHALLPLNNPPKFGIIILRPGDVYGPGSEPWVTRPLQVMDRGLFALPNDGEGMINLTYIDNLADAIFLAIEKKVYGEIINITDGKAITWKQYFTDLARIAGRGKPRSLPYILVKGLVQISSPFLKWILGESPLSPEGIDWIMRPHPVSTEKAKKLLGFKPEVDYEEGMRRTENWIRQNNC